MRASKGPRGRTTKRKVINVLIVDEYPVVRVGLRAMLKTPGLRVVGEAATADAALRLVVTRRPDVVLMEVGALGAEGYDFLRLIKEKRPKVSLVVLTKERSVYHLSRAMAAGCSGFFVKSVGREELLRGIRSIARGECIVEPTLLRELLKEVAQGQDLVKGKAGEALTIPEREIISLIAEGRTNNQIAHRLGYSVGTVKDYVQKIIQKLEVSDRTQAAVKAVRLGLVT